MQERHTGVYYIEFRTPQREDFGWPGLAMRFIISVVGLWVSQWLIDGFDIDTWEALLFGAVIFGVINALIKPVVSFISCPLMILTLGFFTLIINAAMLGLTAWVAGWFDLDFEVDGFIAAFVGALVISLFTTIVGWWGERYVLRPLMAERAGL